MNLKLGIFVWAFLVLHSINAQETTMALESILSKVMDVSLLAPLVDGAPTETNVSLSCKQSLQLLKQSLNNGIPWSLQMLDASGKVGANINSGRNTFRGSYKECSKINIKSAAFTGRFCTSTIASTSENVSWMGAYEFDVCVPSQCSENDIYQSLLNGLKKFGLTTSRPECYKEKVELELCQKIGIIILSILLGIVLFGTLVDVIRNVLTKKKKEFVETSPTTETTKISALKHIAEILCCFSLYTNAKSVLNTKRSSSSITALDGIRFLSTTWIIMYHIFYQTTFLAANLEEFNLNRHQFAFQAVLNASISVDTFFFIGGLLVAYVNLKKLQKSSKYTWGDYFRNLFHRYLRLTPPVIFAILFVFVWPLLGSGPVWFKSINPDYNGCKHSCLFNLAYINNFLGLNNVCMDHLWYLANDMQFFLIAPAILLLLNKYPKKGLLLNFALLLTSIVTAFILGAVYSLQPTTLFFMNVEKMAETYKKVYTKPYTRIGPYCLGLFVGYLLVKKPRVTLKPVVQIAGWCCSFAFCFSTLYGVYNWNQGLRGNLYVNALYLALHRPVWALGVAWVCYVCAIGYGGIVNSILSWKAFGPLSKLTYVAYIIHPIIVKSLVGVQADKLVINDFLWIVIYVGVVGIAFGLSFPITLCIEVPFQGLDKMLLTRSNEKRDTNEQREPISIISPPNYNSTGCDNEAFAIESATDTPNDIHKQGTQRLL